MLIKVRFIQQKRKIIWFEDLATQKYLLVELPTQLYQNYNELINEKKSQNLYSKTKNSIKSEKNKL